MFKYITTFPADNIDRTSASRLFETSFKNNSIVVLADGKDVSFPDHWGPFSLKFALRGTEHYQAGGARYGVSSNNFLVLNEGREYSSWIGRDNDVQSFSIHYSPDHIRELFGTALANDEQILEHNFKSTYRPFIEKLYPSSEVSHLINEMVSRLDRFDDNLLYFHESFARIFDTVFTMQEKVIRDHVNHIPGNKKSTKFELYRRVCVAKDFIDSYYMNPMCLDDLSDASMLSRFHLLRLFKKTFGITPHQYLTTKRLEAAYKMLESGDDPVISVCRKVGYVDQASFSKLFKRRYGVSPSVLGESC